MHFYSFFVSIFVVRFAEYLTILGMKLHIKYPAFWGGLPAVILAIGGVYIVHHLKGTPEPLFSIIPTVIISPPSLWYFAFRQARDKIK